MAVRSVPLICSGHSRPVPDLSYSNPMPDGSFYVISACLDGKPMIRYGDTGDWIGTFEGHKGAVWCARLNNNATLAVTGSADYTAKLWDAVNGVELRTYAHKRIVKACDFSNSGRDIVTGGQDKIIRVWDTETGLCKSEFEGHQDSVRQVLWMKNSENLFLSGGADQVIRMWDIRSGQVSTAFAKSSVASLELSKDSRVLTSAAGKEVTFWDATTLVPIKVFTLNIELNTAALHPNSTKFVAGGAADLHVHMYDFATGEELEVHKGHHGPVHCVRFAPDGETYASGSEDGTVRIWQTIPKNAGVWQTSTAAATTPNSTPNGMKK